MGKKQKKPRDAFEALAKRIEQLEARVEELEAAVAQGVVKAADLPRAEEPDPALLNAKRIYLVGSNVAADLVRGLTDEIYGRTAMAMNPAICADDELVDQWGDGLSATFNQSSRQIAQDVIQTAKEKLELGWIVSENGSLVTEAAWMRFTPMASRRALLMHLQGEVQELLSVDRGIRLETASSQNQSLDDVRDGLYLARRAIDQVFDNLAQDKLSDEGNYGFAGAARAARNVVQKVYDGAARGLDTMTVTEQNLFTYCTMKVALDTLEHAFGLKGHWGNDYSWKPDFYEPGSNVKPPHDYKHAGCMLMLLGITQRANPYGYAASDLQDNGADNSFPAESASGRLLREWERVVEVIHGSLTSGELYRHTLGYYGEQLAKRFPGAAADERGVEPAIDRMSKVLRPLQRELLMASMAQDGWGKNDGFTPPSTGWAPPSIRMH